MVWGQMFHINIMRELPTYINFNQSSLPQPHLLSLCASSSKITKVAAEVTESTFSSMLSALLLATHNPLHRERRLWVALLRVKRTVMQHYIASEIVQSQTLKTLQYETSSSGIYCQFEILVSLREQIRAPEISICHKSAIFNCISARAFAVGRVGKF